MNSQFHTPSLGDEVFDLSGIDDVATTAGANHQTQSDFYGSKRMQNMDQNLTVSGGGNAVTYNTFGGGGAGNNLELTSQNNHATNTSQTPATPTTLAARKQLSPGVTDPNEPAKPLSAYAYFFRDTVSAIKQQNPECNFAELSNIVSSMWEVLDPAQKDVFFKKTDAARAEYIKQTRLYQQQQRLQSQQEQQQQPQNNIDTPPANTLNIMQQEQQQQQSQLVTSTTDVAPTYDLTTNQTQVASQSNNELKTSNQNLENKPDPAEVTAVINGVIICIREGCSRSAIMNPDWEDEYCSNECVVIHCRNVFNAWVQQNKEAAEAAAKEEAEAAAKEAAEATATAAQ